MHLFRGVTKIGAVIQQGQCCFVTTVVVWRRSLLETMKVVIEDEVSYIHDPKMNEEK